MKLLNIYVKTVKIKIFVAHLYRLRVVAGPDLGED